MSRTDCRPAPKLGRVPDGHTKKGCDACQAIANQKADTFLVDVMLPQLKSPTSSQDGLNGTVIPPPWVTEYDPRETWSSKTSTQQSLVFYYGNMGPQNLVCDHVTLEIRYVVDWENAGYFEEEFLHIWAVTGDSGLDGKVDLRHRTACLQRRSSRPIQVPSAHSAAESLVDKQLVRAEPSNMVHPRTRQLRISAGEPRCGGQRTTQREANTPPCQAPICMYLRANPLGASYWALAAAEIDSQREPVTC